jgi:hypothetical protein
MAANGNSCFMALWARWAKKWWKRQ